MCSAILRHSVVSNSLQPHGLQSTKLLCPWGFKRQEYCSGLPCPPLGDLPDPGFKHASLMSPALADGFITTSTAWEALISYQFSSVAQPCPNLCNPMGCSQPGSAVYGDSPGKNTGMGCHALLQGIFLTLGSNRRFLCLLLCKWILYPLSHLGSPVN